MKTHLKEKLHNKHSWGKKSCHTITTITTKDTPKIITVVYSCQKHHTPVVKPNKHSHVDPRNYLCVLLPLC